MGGTRLRAFDAIFCVLILIGLSNFGYHAVQGDYGIFALLRIESQERQLSRELAALRDERARVENAVRRLGDGYLDLDLLDERARAVLGHMRSDEITPR